MSLRATLGRNLKRLRTERGLSQEKLALEADVDRGYVGMIERRKYAASVDVLERIAAALHVDASELLAPSDKARRKK